MMPERIFHKVTIVTENAKDMLALSSAGGSAMTWLADFNVIIQMGAGVISIALLIIRIAYYLRHWNTPPTKR